MLLDEVKRHLQLLGKSYWSTLSKVVNTWRTYGVAKDFYNMWAATYGTQRARVVCGKLPQRALTGRWGSKDSTEQFFIKASKSEMQFIWYAMFVDPEAVYNKKHKRDSTASNDFAEDDEESYALIRNRWIREASEGTKGPHRGMSRYDSDSGSLIQTTNKFK